MHPHCRQPIFLGDTLVDERADAWGRIFRMEKSALLHLFGGFFAITLSSPAGLKAAVKSGKRPRRRWPPGTQGFCHSCGE